MPGNPDHSLVSPKEPITALGSAVRSRTAATPCGTLPLATRTSAFPLASPPHRFASQHDNNWFLNWSASLPNNLELPSMEGITMLLCLIVASLAARRRGRRRRELRGHNIRLMIFTSFRIKQVDDAISACVEQAHELVIPCVLRSPQTVAAWPSWSNPLTNLDHGGQGAVARRSLRP